MIGEKQVPPVGRNDKRFSLLWVGLGARGWDDFKDKGKGNGLLLT